MDEPIDSEQRDGDGRGGDVAGCRGGESKQRGVFVVVDKNVVALKVRIQIVFHCYAR